MNQHQISLIERLRRQANEPGFSRYDRTTARLAIAEIEALAAKVPCHHVFEIARVAPGVLTARQPTQMRCTKCGYTT